MRFDGSIGLFQFFSRIYLACLLHKSCVSECVSQYVVLAGAAEAVRQIGGELRQAGIAPKASATHLKALRQGLILQQPGFVVICVALSEKSTRRHHDELRTFLDDMRSLPGSVRSIGITPDLGPGLTGQLASLGFDLYLNDPDQAKSAIETIRHEVSNTGSSRFDALCEIELEDKAWPLTWLPGQDNGRHGIHGVDRFNFEHE